MDAGEKCDPPLLNPSPKRDIECSLVHKHVSQLFHACEEHKAGTNKTCSSATETAKLQPFLYYSRT